jgi:hypothetical protein
MRFEFAITVGLSFKDKHYVGEKMYTDSSWARLRRIVKRRDHATCRYCGSKDADGHVDHVIPLSRGGSDSLDNLVWACSTCNLRKGSKTAGEFSISAPGYTKRDLDDAALPGDLEGLPVPLGQFAELVEGVMRGDLAWSRASMMSIGITDPTSRSLKLYLKDKGWITTNGNIRGGYTTTENGLAVLRRVVSSLRNAPESGSDHG